MKRQICKQLSYNIIYRCLAKQKTCCFGLLVPLLLGNHNDSHRTVIFLNGEKHSLSFLLPSRVSSQCFVYDRYLINIYWSITIFSYLTILLYLPVLFYSYLFYYLFYSTYSNFIHTMYSIGEVSVSSLLKFYMTYCK